MMKFLYVVVCLLCFSGSVNGVYAQSVKDYFLQMPDSLLPYLTTVNKADMPDFRSSKMAAKVKNRFEEMTEMTQLTSDFLEIQTSPSSFFQMKVLPLPDSTCVIAVITAVKAPALDSRVRFFTPDWKEVSAVRFLSLPTVDDFLLPVGAVKTAILFDSCGASSEAVLSDTISVDLRAEVFSELNAVPLFSCSFSSEDQSIRVTLTTPDYLDEKNGKEAEYYIKKDPILLFWKEGKFLIGNN